MATTSADATKYDASLDSTKWYETQGPAYRRAQEMAERKKKKVDPIMAYMEKKLGCFKRWWVV